MPESSTSPKRFPKEAKAYLSAIVSSPGSKTRRRLGLRSRSSSDETLSTSSFATSRVLGHESPLSYKSSSRASQTSSSSSQTSALPPIPQNALHIEPTAAFDADPHWLPYPDDPHALRHAEFGFDDHPEYRYTSQWRGPDIDSIEVDEVEPSLATYLTTYISYLILIVIGHVRDFVGKRTHRTWYKSLMEQNGYAPLNSDFDSFYTRRLKTRIEDLFSRPVTGVAGRTIVCMDRESPDFGLTFKFKGSTTQALNISSYNYLGFAQSRGGCTDAVEAILHTHGISAAGARADVGTLDLHHQVERLVARFMGVEDAMVISQGFATNSTTLPAMVSKGCLIISDELNHSSIRFGARMSGAMVRQFKHNDMKDLEALLRECISQGQPRTHRPWKKILLVVEGLYSMEGTLLNLPVIMALKKKYKFALWVDEAHSIGAIGPRGRGVCDYFNIDPQSVDVLMGTFTKSFGAAGGYIAGKKSVIAPLRKLCHSMIYAESMPPTVIQQIIASMASIMGPEALDVIPALAQALPPRLLDGSEGLERLRRLAFNARYLSTGLRKLGFIVYGHKDSPIVPLLLFNPGKMGLFSRLMLERYQIAVVVVAYPATPLVSSRARFCLSAAHTKDDLDRVLRAADEVGDIVGLKMAPGKHLSIDKVIATNAKAVLEL